MIFVISTSNYMTIGKFHFFKSQKVEFCISVLFVLHTRISGVKFVKYSIEFRYFGLSDNQHDFILLIEADLSHCKIYGITVCPADVAILDSDIKL